MTISRLKTNREAIYRRVGACCAIAANIGVTALALCALGVTFEFRPTLWTWLLRAVVLWAFVAVVLDIAVEYYRYMRTLTQYEIALKERHEVMAELSQCGRQLVDLQPENSDDTE